MTRTFSSLSYDYLQPGMHTREQFEEGAARLETLRAGAVLYEPDFVGKIPAAWPRTPAAKMLQDPVADYLLQNYRVCAILDRDSPASFLFDGYGRTCPAPLTAEPVRTARRRSRDALGGSYRARPIPLPALA